MHGDNPSPVPIVGNFLQPYHFQQPHPSTQMNAPNITTQNMFSNSTIWSNDLNGGNDNRRPQFGNIGGGQSMSFSLVTPVQQNFNANEVNTNTNNNNSFIDLDSQLLNNLSGDLQSFSFSDFSMELLSKNEDKPNNVNKPLHK